MVRKITFPAPFAAPKYHSARAPVLPSCSTKTGKPKRSMSRSFSGISSQCGRFGGERMIPRSLSMGPPMLTESASGAGPRRSASARGVIHGAAELIEDRRESPVGPGWGRRCGRRFHRRRPPRMTAVLVPPMSRPTMMRGSVMIIPRRSVDEAELLRPGDVIKKWSKVFPGELQSFDLLEGTSSFVSVVGIDRGSPSPR